MYLRRGTRSTDFLFLCKNDVCAWQYRYRFYYSSIIKTYSHLWCAAWFYLHCLYYFTQYLKGNLIQYVDGRATVVTNISPWLVITDGVNWWKTQINILMSKSFIGIIQKGRKKYVIGVDLITKDSSLTDEVIVGYLLTLNTSDKLAVIKMKCYLPCLLDLLVIYLIHLDYIWWIFHSHIK